MSGLVRARLAELLSAQGKLTFAEFMDIALYHPTAGYYNRPEMTIGPGGDFYTSPMVHPIFGACVARQVWQMWNLLGKPDPFFVLEMGAGVGAMAVDFLRMAERDAAFYRAVRYHIVEQGAALRERQQAAAEAAGQRGKIEWFETLGQLPGGQVGVIFSNELFDALPVHRLGKAESGYVEFYIEADGNGYRETAGELSDPQLVALVDEATLTQLQPGERFEVCPAAGEVIEAMGRLLERGFVLTIDYGNLAPDVHLRHRKGTGVRAFWKQKLTEPLERVGEQDLTADLDFSLLIRRGEQAGLQEVGFTDQMHLLGGNGFLQKVAELQKRAREHMDLMADEELHKMLALFMPQSLGEVFKVLIQAKGLEAAALKDKIGALTFSLDE
ncbi:SAM-dependent MidA family methyltransferase [Tumebacillus sp. BK434]|uniref:class I SAM-dependent methyltransferase n=1 Tax=Tumebacillus sp. BK434 TaxID=2512169 RepID=UPI0010EEF03B|nr:SAM-dependent methyltransferase [Tumebacillus sp. BK434]TCP55377.1 SAM-dependent MidA family methyltransferase [Tumebacillus sp. BK434]